MLYTPDIENIYNRSTAAEEGKVVLYSRNMDIGAYSRHCSLRKQQSATQNMALFIK